MDQFPMQTHRARAKEDLNRELLDQKKVLVVGQGSIGQRHFRILSAAGAVVHTVSSHLDGSHRSIKEAFDSLAFDYVVIANQTSQHKNSMLELLELNFSGHLLVEKPISNFDNINSDLAKEFEVFERFGVGYNLRFHPLLYSCRRLIANQRILSAQFYVGQHLASWRNTSDFRKDSSALLSAGGGVLRDLSHEIDLALHLFGVPVSLVANGSNLGALGIETDEAWDILLRFENFGPISLHLNYFDRPPRRFIHINTDETTIHIDFIEGSVITSSNISEKSAAERDQTYASMHNAMLSDDPGPLCGLSESLQVLRVIDAVERSHATRSWIFL